MALSILQVVTNLFSTVLISGKNHKSHVAIFDEKSECGQTITFYRKKKRKLEATCVTARCHRESHSSWRSLKKCFQKWKTNQGFIDLRLLLWSQQTFHSSSYRWVSSLPCVKSNDLRLSFHAIWLPQGHFPWSSVSSKAGGLSPSVVLGGSMQFESHGLRFIFWHGNTSQAVFRWFYLRMVQL